MPLILGSVAVGVIVATLAFVFWPKKKQPQPPPTGSWTTPVTPTTPAPKPPATTTAPGKLWNVEFSIRPPNASKVFLGGEFNKWSQTANPLQKRPNGDWVVSMKLQGGTYKYKFFVDGKWTPDPDNPERTKDSYGDSILHVGN